MNLPIRVNFLLDNWWYPLKNNLNDTIGSDHAPHTKENKEKAYPFSPSGMPGVQTIVPMMLDHVSQGNLSIFTLVDLMSYAPAKIFGLINKGRIAVGYDADLTIVDMNKEVVIKDDWIESKCGWTPFNNYKAKGFPVATIVNGEIVMENSKIISPAKGKPLNF